MANITGPAKAVGKEIAKEVAETAPQLFGIAKRDLEDIATVAPAKLNQFLADKGIPKDKSFNLIKSLANKLELGEGNVATLERAGIKVDSPPVRSISYDAAKKAGAGALAAGAAMTMGEDESSAAPVSDDNQSKEASGNLEKTLRGDGLPKTETPETSPRPAQSSPQWPDGAKGESETKEPEAPNRLAASLAEKEAPVPTSQARAPQTGGGTYVAKEPTTKVPEVSDRPVRAETTKQAEEELDKFNNEIINQRQQLINSYKEEKGTIGWLRAAEALAHAVVSYSAAKEGLKTGQNLSNIKIQGTDWNTYLNDAKDSFNVGMEQADFLNKTKGGQMRDLIKEAKDQEDKLLDYQRRQRDILDARRFQEQQTETGRQFTSEENELAGQRAEKLKRMELAHKESDKGPNWLTKHEITRKEKEEDDAAKQKFRKDLIEEQNKEKLRAEEEKRQRAIDTDIGIAAGIMSGPASSRDKIHQLNQLKNIPVDIRKGLVDREDSWWFNNLSRGDAVEFLDQMIKEREAAKASKSSQPKTPQADREETSSVPEPSKESPIYITDGKGNTSYVTTKGQLDDAMKKGWKPK